MVSDSIIAFGVGVAANYAILYRKNKFFGGLMFMGLGLGIAFLTAETGNAKAFIQLTGIITAIAGFMSIIYTITKNSK